MGRYSIKLDLEEALRGGLNWKNLAMNRNGWRIGCETIWSFSDQIKPKKKKFVLRYF